uniref:Uncharacterized protein n=1 Tax=Setaria viridis TaxID=4556 RepID=A0A4U6VDP5_SETVI|nr:hypothetical protein SEVIR_3G157900v2 [Setaria viridis]
MAGLLLIQKLSSGVYIRSTGRLGMAVAPVTRTASAVRYFSIVPFSHAEVKTIWPVKRAFSSSSFNKHKLTPKAPMEPLNSCR